MMNYSNEQKEMISKDFQVLEFFRQEENKLDVIRFYNLVTDQRLSGLEDRYHQLQCNYQLQPHTVSNGRLEDVEKMVEKLSKDQDGVRLSLSELNTTTQNIQGDIETLGAKVHDNYTQFMAEGARSSNEVAVINKKVDDLCAKSRCIEKAVEDLCAKMLESQEMVELKKRLAEFQESANETLSDPLSQTTVDESNEGQFPASMPVVTPPPTKAVRLLEKYNLFKASYRQRRPRSEAAFIRAYLEGIDRVSAWFIQKKLHKEYPQLVRILEIVEKNKKTGVKIFITLDQLSWKHVRNTMHRLSCKELFPLLREEQVQLDIPESRRLYNLRSNPTRYESTN